MEDFLLGQGVFLYVSVHSIIVLRDGQGLVVFSNSYFHLHILTHCSISYLAIFDNKVNIKEGRWLYGK